MVFPPSFEEWLFIGHIVRVRVEVVSQSAWQQPRTLAALQEESGDPMISFGLDSSSHNESDKRTVLTEDEA